MTLLHTPPSALEDLRVSLLWDILFFYQQTLLFLKCLHLLTYQLQVKTRNFLQVQGWLCDAGRRSRLVEQNQKPKWVYQLLFGYTLGWLVTSATIRGSLTPCWKLVKMAICGPKLSLIGVVLSAWGIIQLVGGTSLPFCSNWFIRSGC